MLLDQINQPGDIKKIDHSDLPALSKEIRSFLIEKLSVTGGHLASNLGVVELTMALHIVSAVWILYFLANSFFANTIPCLVFGSPPTAIGTVLYSGWSIDSADAKNELQSQCNITRSFMVSKFP